MQISIILLQFTAGSWDLQNQYMMTSYQHRNDFFCVQINCLLIAINCLRLCTVCFLHSVLIQQILAIFSVTITSYLGPDFMLLPLFFSVLSRSPNTSSSRPVIFQILYVVLKVLACPKTSGSVRYLSVSQGRRHLFHSICISDRASADDIQHICFLASSFSSRILCPFQDNPVELNNSEMKFVCWLVLS